MTAYPMLWDHEAELIFEGLVTIAEKNERIMRRQNLPAEVARIFEVQAGQARKLAGRIARTFINEEIMQHAKRRAVDAMDARLLEMALSIPSEVAR